MHPAVRAAGSILVTPRALVGGRFGQGGWLAILVDLRNDGPPVSGAIVANFALVALLLLVSDRARRPG